jgi:hypothetical protein
MLCKIEAQYGRVNRVWVMDRGIPTEEVLAEMRAAHPPVSYLVGTPKGRLIEWSRGAYMIIDRRTANPIARLRPIPDTDRFELFYWSNDKGRWTTFGNLGRRSTGMMSGEGDLRRTWHELTRNWRVVARAQRDLV